MVKLWPQKKWKKILLIILLTFIIISSLLLVYASFVMNNDVISELVIKNPQGSKTALLFYHPGLSSFSNDVSYAFAEGLTSNNWRVEIATPSNNAPTKLSEYGLLIIVSNTYGFKPDSPTTRQLDRIGNLDGIQTVLLTLGAGSASESKQSLESMVEAQNGTIIRSLLVYSLAPNEENKSPIELAKETAIGLD
jgi:hypothetical protein